MRPGRRRPPTAHMAPDHLSWDHATVLHIIFLVVFTLLVRLAHGEVT